MENISPFTRFAMSTLSTNDGFALRHEIFVLDAHLEESLDESRYEEITVSLINKLLKTLGMERLGELQIYPAVDMRAPGWSFIQPITTSHISGHYFEKPGRLPHIRMDIYSCEAVNWRDVIATLHGELMLADWRATFLQRSIEPGESRPAIDIAGRGAEVLTETSLLPERLAAAIA